jgi:DNA-binding GntR family transcriptional regulator
MPEAGARVTALENIAADEPAPKLSELAYRRFKEALFAKRIQAGSTVSQADLVAVTGVPISPLREAMQVLQSEGLIRILPRSGILITKPDLALLRNAFQLREVLEVPAIRHMAGAMPREELLTIEAVHQELLDRTPGLEVTPEVAQRVSALDQAFHFDAVRFLSNPLLQRAHEQAFDCIRLIRLDQLYMLSAAAIARTMQEHLAIIRACLARDPDAAVAALELHFAKAMQRALGV